MTMTNITQGFNVAALRGQQGSRTLYQVLVPNSVLNNFFTVNMDPPTERSQRQLDPKHAKDIATYVLENPDEYVLGAIVYAVDQECTFTPSELSDSVGILTIPFGTNLRSLDGQHRRQGLNDAIADDEDLGNDHTAVLIYVESDVTRRRQMFSDMNATPKIVAKAINVAFDARDPFARVAQDLAKTHPFLTGVVEMEAARVRASSDKWFNLGAIHDALKRLQVGPNGRVRNPVQYAEDAISDLGSEFFDLLATRPEFDEARHSVSVEVLRSKSILFSSTTLRAIAGAIWLRLQEDGEDTALVDYADLLGKIDFGPSAKVWRDTGFVSAGKSTPNARNQEVLAATKAIAEALA
jgi:DGQHR domain-containing protein